MRGRHSSCHFARGEKGHSAGVLAPQFRDAGVFPRVGVSWAARRGSGSSEIVVSLAVFALVALPMTRIIVTTENASDTLHLRAEAVDLASQALETAQYKTQNGVNPTQGITTSTQYSGNDKFTVATDFELAPGTGTSSSICIAPPGQLSSQIWTIKATVTWGVGGQSGKVIESTLVSPSQVDLADTNAAEIAVPVYTAQDDPSQLETTASVSMTATGASASGSCGTVPGNEVTTETVNSGSTGCAVFTGLFAGAGETYTITVTPPTGYVDPLEKWWNPNTGALTFYSNVAPPPNEVDVVNNPNLILAPAAPVTVNFQTMSFSGGTDPGVTPSADIPIAVQSSGLLCPSGTTVPICVIGDGASAVTNGEGVQLFPGASVTDVQVASVTTNSTTSVTVASGGFPGVLAGWGVSGTGIPNSDTVASISGNTLTLSVGRHGERGCHAHLPSAQLPGLDRRCPRQPAQQRGLRGHHRADKLPGPVRDGRDGHAAGLSPAAEGPGPFRSRVGLVLAGIGLERGRQHGLDRHWQHRRGRCFGLRGPPAGPVRTAGDR